MLANAYDAVVGYSLDNKITYWNRAAEQLYGFTAEEALGRISYELLKPTYPHARDREEIVKQINEAGRVEGESTRSRSRVRSVLIRGVDGSPTGYVSFDRDITERKKTKENVQRVTEELCAFVLTSSDDVVYRMSPDWTQMTYLRGANFIPDTDKPSENWVEKYILPEDRTHVSAVIQQAIETKSVFELEHRVIRVDGSVGWTFSRAAPLLDKKGKEIVEWFGTAKDVTERKEKDRLAAIGATAGMVGHDIRSPLQAIAGALYLLSSGVASLPEGEAKESIKESIASVKESAQYIEKIIQDLQGFAKPLRPVAQETNLEEVVQEVLFKNDIAGDIDVSCEVQDEARKLVADPDLLKRILRNLVSNAVQAMPMGGKLTIQGFKDAEGLPLVLFMLTVVNQTVYLLQQQP